MKTRKIILAIGLVLGMATISCEKEDDGNDFNCLIQVDKIRDAMRASESAYKLGIISERDFKTVMIRHEKNLDRAYAGCN